MATANLVVNSVVNNRKSSEGKVNLSLSAISFPTVIARPTESAEAI